MSRAHAEIVIAALEEYKDANDKKTAYERMKAIAKRTTDAIFWAADTDKNGELNFHGEYWDILGILDGQGA